MEKTTDTHTELRLSKNIIYVTDKWDMSKWEFESQITAQNIFKKIKQTYLHEPHEIPLYEVAYRVCRKEFGFEHINPSEIYNWK